MRILKDIRAQLLHDHGIQGLNLGFRWNEQTMVKYDLARMARCPASGQLVPEMAVMSPGMKDVTISGCGGICSGRRVDRCSSTGSRVWEAMDMLVIDELGAHEESCLCDTAGQADEPRPSHRGQ